MKRSLTASIAILSVLTWIYFSGGDQSDRYLTTTLLPSEDKVLGENGQREVPREPYESYLWVQQKPKKRIFLRFDLKGLPPNIKEFKNCSLRIVAKEYKYMPPDSETGGDTVILKGRLPEDKEWIFSCNDIGSNSKATVALGEFEHKFSNKDRFFDLILETGSDKAGALFYSKEEYGEDPSNIPRLVIQYTLGPPTLLESLSWAQHQQNPEHTGRTPWRPFRAPNGFSLVCIPLPKIGENGGSVADYPLIYQGNIYLISKVLKQNYLLSLDFKGVERWRRDIGEGTVQRSPVISRQGVIYVVTGNKITGYDLNKSGEVYATYALLSGEQKLSAYTGLTHGNDGSLFLAMVENDLNFIYGFTPSLVPFLKAGPFGGGQEKISTITVSPDGRKIFAQIPAGAVVIDIANPSEQKTITLANGKDKPWEYYYVPVAGPKEDVMIFSDFTSKANSGNIWGYSEKQRIWNASGTLLPQPALGSNGRVYYIQDGALHGHAYDQSGSAAITAGTGLNTTSNLVMDGADNIYFWDNGYLHGYSPEGERLFERIDLTKEGLEWQRPADPEEVSDTTKPERSKESSGPEQFIRLMLGPDGTLWANNKSGDELFAFNPRFSAADVTLKQEDIKTKTVYRATGTLTVGGVELESGVHILLQAQKSIAFSKGFAVQKGASLLCRTGF